MESLTLLNVAGVMATAAEERTARDLRDVKGEEGA
jgi:hypothetical protein